MHISHNALLSANFYSLNSNSPLLLVLETNLRGYFGHIIFLQKRYDCQSEAWLVKSYIYYYQMGYNDELTSKYNSSKMKPWNYKNFEWLMKHSYNKLSYFMNTCHKNYELSLLHSVAVTQIIWLIFMYIIRYSVGKRRHQEVLSGRSGKHPGHWEASQRRVRCMVKKQAISLWMHNSAMKQNMCWLWS